MSKKGRRLTAAEIRLLSRGPVAPEEDMQPSARKDAKASTGSSNSKGDAQRRYQREALLSRAFLRDHMPKEFARIAKSVGRRRPTFKMGKRKSKKGKNGNGPVSL